MQRLPLAALIVSQGLGRAKEASTGQQWDKLSTSYNSEPVK